MTRVIRSPSTLAAALVLIAPLVAAPSLAQEIKAGQIVITARAP